MNPLPSPFPWHVERAGNIATLRDKNGLVIGVINNVDTAFLIIECINGLYEIDVCRNVNPS